MRTNCEVWTWTDNQLRDPQGVVVAEVRNRVVHVGAQHILTEVSRDKLQLVVRGTTSQEEVFSVIQDGFSLAKLAGNCSGRRYRLERTHRFRRERRILDSHMREIARTRPKGNALEIWGDFDDVPKLDSVFLTYACVEADNSAQVRI